MHIRKVSYGVTTFIGILVILLSLSPPNLIVWLNLFSLGGLESVFIWPVVLGLYWQGGNKHGAITSIVLGMGTYTLFDRFLSPCIRPPNGCPFVTGCFCSLLHSYELKQRIIIEPFPKMAKRLEVSSLFKVHASLVFLST
jgi:Na+/proline symporter